jgi:hypothetical protein
VPILPIRSFLVCDNFHFRVIQEAERNYYMIARAIRHECCQDEHKTGIKINIVGALTVTYQWSDSNENLFTFLVILNLSPAIL